MIKKDARQEQGVVGMAGYIAKTSKKNRLANAEDVPAVEMYAEPLEKRNNMCGKKRCHGRCVLMQCIPK